MEKNLIFKTVALAAMVVGGASIAIATAANVRRKEDEEEAANAMIETEIIAQNFSGAVGRMRNPSFGRTSFGRTFAARRPRVASRVSRNIWRSPSFSRKSRYCEHKNDPRQAVDCGTRNASNVPF